jgi:hypothetical protein
MVNSEGLDPSEITSMGEVTTLEQVLNNELVFIQDSKHQIDKIKEICRKHKGLLEGDPSVSIDFVYVDKIPDIRMDILQNYKKYGLQLSNALAANLLKTYESDSRKSETQQLNKWLEENVSGWQYGDKMLVKQAAQELGAYVPAKDGGPESIDVSKTQAIMTAYRRKTARKSLMPVPPVAESVQNTAPLYESVQEQSLITNLQALDLATRMIQEELGIAGPELMKLTMTNYLMNFYSAYNINLMKTAELNRNMVESFTQQFIGMRKR